MAAELSTRLLVLIHALGGFAVWPVSPLLAVSSQMPRHFAFTAHGLFVLFGWTASLFYHLFGGLRHLAWDFGYGYELQQTHASGWAAVIATLVATVLTWVAGFWMLRP